MLSSSAAYFPSIITLLAMAVSRAVSFKVDVHTHPVPDFYLEALANAGYNATTSTDVFVDGFRTPDWQLESYLAERVKDGYKYSILSITAPGVNFLKGNYHARILARRLNDQMSTWAQEHPQQLGAFGILPLPDIESSLAEISYCLDTLNFEGIGMYTNVNGVYLGNPLLDPIMAELNRRNATVFVHPAGPPESPALPGMSLPVIEYTFDTTRAIANLLFTQTRARYPNINMIFSHGGGTLPFLANRLALQSTLPFQGGRNYNESLAELRGYYYDTAVTFGNPQFAALKEFVGSRRMLTGSDCELTIP
jgi:6-methylsalicylate decarboxylase